MMVVLNESGVHAVTGWGELAQRLRFAVSKAGGPTVESSGGLKVIFTSYGEVCVEIGGQDIDDWRRHEPVGRFDTEVVAMSATLKKVEEAEAILTGLGDDEHPRSTS